MFTGVPYRDTVISLPIVIAHRGASGYRPEHTRSAYELAIAMGADAIEPDVVATQDRVLVLRHENEISGTTDVADHPEFADRKTTKVVDGRRLTGWFTEDFTWAELSTLRMRERIPRTRRRNRRYENAEPMLRLRDLLDMLDAAGRRVALVAELKHARYFESVGLALDELFAAELRDAGWADDDRLTVESFEKSVLLKVRQRGIGGRLVFLIDAKGAPADETGPDARSYADYLTLGALVALADEVDGISLHKRLVLPKNTDPKSLERSPVIDAAHSAGLTVFCWTLRPENKFLDRSLRIGLDPSAYGRWKREFRAIMRVGVDGVFADCPDLALRARASLLD